MFRFYAPDECTGKDGYPEAWHETLKHEVRAQAEHRCIRCLHPYVKGAGRWSPCDDRCLHRGPLRYRAGDGWEWDEVNGPDCEEDWIGVAGEGITVGCDVEAEYRILTVHHLDGNKGNCRWWNLVALCQRCHLTVQGKVKMERRWLHEHSEWFKPYVAGYYAHVYLGEDVTREQAEARLDELLALEHRQMEIA
jgi:hypothetical protein